MRVRARNYVFTVGVELPTPNCSTFDTFFTKAFNDTGKFEDMLFFAPYVTQYCFHAGNRATVRDFGRILMGEASTSAHGRPLAGRTSDFEVFQTRIRPKSGRETQFPDRKQYCIT